MRTSQTVTHPGTAPTRVRLTLEFLCNSLPHNFKRRYVELIQSLPYKSRVNTWIFQPMVDTLCPVIKGVNQTKFSYLSSYTNNLFPIFCTSPNSHIPSYISLFLYCHFLRIYEGSPPCGYCCRFYRA